MSLLVACESKPAESPKTVEMVPIEPDAGVAPAPSQTATATQPDVTPVTTSAAPAPSSTASTAATSSAGGPRISPKECDKLVDHMLDVMIAGDPRLSGMVTPEMIATAKAQVKGQQGMGPCDEQVVTKKMYGCAMSSKSSDGIKACLK
ncbi:MAG: hypothetical protein HOO96_44140 [Polyangiaceae bacterium]|nr:hypothetical protein [Polyangiaceae bacterium]